MLRPNQFASAEMLLSDTSIEKPPGCLPEEIQGLYVRCPASLAVSAESRPARLSQLVIACRLSINCPKLQLKEIRVSAKICVLYC